jgi:hypothetical protein
MSNAVSATSVAAPITDAQNKQLFQSNMTLCCCEYCKPDQMVGSLSSRAVAGRPRDLSRRKQTARGVCSLIAVAHARLRHTRRINSTAI